MKTLKIRSILKDLVIRYILTPLSKKKAKLTAKWNGEGQLWVRLPINNRFFSADEVIISGDNVYVQVNKEER